MSISLSRAKAALPYEVDKLPRELKEHYISASEQDIQAMLKTLHMEELDDLYTDIPNDVKFKKPVDIPNSLSYFGLKEEVEKIARKNRPRTSFIGDELPVFKLPEVLLSKIANIRSLTTSYTPYQPERSQGTLVSLWIYQCMMRVLTGFEAINSSMYDRSTAIYEAIRCAVRLNKKSGRKILILGSLFEVDISCLRTLACNTDIKLEILPFLRSYQGTFPVEVVEESINKYRDELSAIVFPQMNALGFLEEVDKLTDLATDNEIRSIAVIDPVLLGEKGLKRPCDFGTCKRGVDIIAGEGQHLAIKPNFGGPGLGILGVRHHDDRPNDIRALAGKIVGDAFDSYKRKCKVLVLSTREQHIRREKATSNICSNQAFIATLAGAALLAKGNLGIKKSLLKARKNTLLFLRVIEIYTGVKIWQEAKPFFNEVILQLENQSVENLIIEARDFDLWLGVDVSTRAGIIDSNFDENKSKSKRQDADGYLKISFSDCHDDKHMKKLLNFFDYRFKKRSKSTGQKKDQKFKQIQNYLHQGALPLLRISQNKILKYYRKLGKQNISPDEACYPLGSCTMKYNPYINDYAANLEDFQNIHPQALLADCQGCLEIIYYNQEYFKKIVGLPYITTQPVAGAQGETIGLKLFQAYHRDKDKSEERDIILIPRSAHGTNPATVVYVGFSDTFTEENGGIIFIDAEKETGMIDFFSIKAQVKKHHRRIAGIMITNPNTSGVFEKHFKKIADIIHSVGGLIYMDGANMNAIAGWVDLGAMGVDAVHNNTHKTWSIPHGGGGPGDAFLAVSDKLAPYLPGVQVVLEDGVYNLHRSKKSIGNFHRHFGNFAHKVRAYTYIRRLGKDGIKKMSAVSVLSANYMQKLLRESYPLLPENTQNIQRLHEFIITLPKSLFDSILEVGIPRAEIIKYFGKLFLDFGFHSPTVAFPEAHGLMIEPTESYSKKELDRLIEAILFMKKLLIKQPSILKTTPHFTPHSRIDEVNANRSLQVSENLKKLPLLFRNRLSQHRLHEMSLTNIAEKILDEYNYLIKLR